MITLKPVGTKAMKPEVEMETIELPLGKFEYPKGMLSELKETAHLWGETQKVLREYYDITSQEKCKDCKSCCCRNCKAGHDIPGYFTRFDYVMFRLNKWTIPIPNKNGDYLTKKGCSLDKNRRSKTCLFYTCAYDTLNNILTNKWSNVGYIISGDWKDNKLYSLNMMIENLIRAVSDRNKILLELKEARRYTIK